MSLIAILAHRFRSAILYQFVDDGPVCLQPLAIYLSTPQRPFASHAHFPAVGFDDDLLVSIGRRFVYGSGVLYLPTCPTMGECESLLPPSYSLACGFALRTTRSGCKSTPPMRRGGSTTST